MQKVHRDFKFVYPIDLLTSLLGFIAIRFSEFVYRSTEAYRKPSGCSFSGKRRDGRRNHPVGIHSRLAPRLSAGYPGPVFVLIERQTLSLKRLKQLPNQITNNLSPILTLRNEYNFHFSVISTVDGR